MEQLFNYIDNLLKWSKQTPAAAETFFNQAFGAVQFYILEHNLSAEDFTALENKWNQVYRPQFEEEM